MSARKQYPDPVPLDTLRWLNATCRDATVRELLWEIWRLQQVVRRGEQILRILDGERPGGVQIHPHTQPILDELRRWYEAEPILVHDRQWRDELLHPERLSREEKREERDERNA